MTTGFLRFLRGNTIALLALFLALGGTTYAAVSLPANSVGTKQLKKNAVTAVKIRKSAVTNPKIANNAVTGGKVKDDSLTGADVLESSLGTVPSATHATSADNATHATSANTAAPSGAAGGALSGSYPNPSLAPPEAWHEIGAAGQPAFQNSWINEDPTGEVTAAFYKDPFGVVHLKGLVTGGSNATIFTLPAGYRPGKNLVSLMWRASGTGMVIICASSACVGGAGDVYINNGTGAGDLDPVSFRAGE
jgi:hypothetical protein